MWHYWMLGMLRAEWATSTSKQISEQNLLKIKLCEGAGWKLEHLKSHLYRSSLVLCSMGARLYQLTDCSILLCFGVHAHGSYIVVGQSAFISVCSSWDPVKYIQCSNAHTLKYINCYWNATGCLERSADVLHWSEARTVALYFHVPRFCCGYGPGSNCIETAVY